MPDDLDPQDDAVPGRNRPPSEDRPPGDPLPSSLASIASLTRDLEGRTVLSAVEELPALDERLALSALIGEGGMGRVYLGTWHDTGETVAAKRLYDHVAGDPDLVRRFLNEVDLLRRYPHPSIVRFVAVGRLRDAPTLVTEYLPGGSLASRVLRQGRIPEVQAIGYMLEALDALAFLHGHGCMHRDVKPDNILVGDDDVARLADFGVAVHPEHRVTRVGLAVGTPGFMPPEQYWSSHKAQPSHDLYGIGTTLFNVLTLESSMMLMVQHLRDEALELVSGPIAEIIEKATHPDPQRRYRRASKMADDLADALDRI